MPFTIGGEWIPEPFKKPSQPVKIRVEKRGNSLVTLISYLPLEPEALKKLCSALKQQFGCGGSCKDDVIELQGDKQKQARDYLSKEGIKIK